MSDIGSPAAAVEPVAAPVSDAPVAVSSVPIPAVSSDPVIEATVVEAAPAVVAEPEVKVEATTLPAVEAKPAEPVVADKPASLLAEAGKEDGEPTPEIVPAEVVASAFEPFALPEGVAIEAEGAKAFTDILGQFEVDAKADHRLTQDLGQKLMDFYVGQKQADQKAQEKLWVDTRKSWQDEIKADPIYGRNRHETFMRDAALIRDKFGSDRFKAMIDLTGAGDHPGMMDFVHNVAKFLDRHGLLREGKPVPAQQQKAVPAKSGPRSRYTANSVQ